LILNGGVSDDRGKVVIAPTVINYSIYDKNWTPVNQYTNNDPVRGVAIRLIPFFQFMPPPIPLGRHRNRPQTASEFAMWYTALLSNINPPYDEAWVAQAIYSDCGQTYVQSAGIIYRRSNTFGIWANASNAFTIVHPLPKNSRGRQAAAITSPGAMTNTPPSSGPDFGGGT
jgi:hypothetical protein